MQRDFGFAGMTALRRIGVVLLLLPALAGTVHSQGTSVEELERRLQKAKEDKARRESEASRAAADRRAQDARQAKLVVQTDAPCTLLVNGKETARLAKGITEVRVSPGQMLVSCASSEEKVAYEGEIEGRSGQSAVLRIALAGKVADIRSARAAALEREAQARREAEVKAREFRAACERGGRRSLMDVTNDSSVLQQCGTGLQWTRSDNGSDVNWAEAQSHCRGMGGGWSLPTVGQLQSLFDAALPGIRCGTSTCKVSDQFRLSEWWFWTSEPNGSSEAWNVGLYDGNRSSLHVGLRNGSRAVCVRRP